jgi:hypothetical protein
MERPQPMRQVVLIRLCLLFLSAATATVAGAEPWLSTRYAQNCAGCHAPGRKNLAPVDRRCTLSCQGCHINPNGGGLRSGYGKWNEERWLRTFRSDLLRHEKSVAPVSRQYYGSGEKKVAKKKSRKAKKESAAGKKLKMPKGGFPLVEIDAAGLPEQPYLRDGLEFVNATREEFLYQIPQHDPYRQLEESKIDGGADVRSQFTQYKYTDNDESTPDPDKAEWRRFLMSVDFSLRWRPVHRKIHLVYESRMLGSPVPDAKYEDTLKQSSTRSLYLIAEDLPYNVFVMGGYYRPLFGNYIPDHYAISQEMTSYAMTGSTKNYGIVYNAVSAGTAPNVPYLNVHLIQKKIGDKDDKTKGYAINTGLRFVTLGASLNYSYWRTRDERADRTTAVEMHSFNAAALLFRTTTSLELVSLARDVDTEDFRQGGVYMLDTYTQIWRENYFTLAYSLANTTRELKPGKTNQTKIGLKSFIIPGVEMNLSMDNRQETAEQSDGSSKVTTVKGYAGQMHLFF